MIEIVNLNTVNRKDLLLELKNGLEKYRYPETHNIWEVSDRLIKNDLAWIKSGKVNLIGRIFERNLKRYFFIYYIWGNDLKNHINDLELFIINILGCTNIEFCSNTPIHNRLYNILSKKHKSTKYLTYDVELRYNK